MSFPRAYLTVQVSRLMALQFVKLFFLQNTSLDLYLGCSFILLVIGKVNKSATMEFNQCRILYSNHWLFANCYIPERVVASTNFFLYAMLRVLKFCMHSTLCVCLVDCMFPGNSLLLVKVKKVSTKFLKAYFSKLLLMITKETMFIFQTGCEIISYFV